jgi:hypothetical protein
MFSSNMFFCKSEVYISKASREHQARPIPTPYEHRANFCSKQKFSSFSMYCPEGDHYRVKWNAPDFVNCFLQGA